jgi:hypothetical protein
LIEKENSKVTIATNSYIYNILRNSCIEIDSDFRFVLRNVLYRGAEEANYLSFQFDGDDSEAFRRARIYLEGIILDLPDMLDHHGNVLPHCRVTILEAVTLARYLMSIEWQQAAAQLDMLEEQLEGCPCFECQGTLKVA